MADTLWRFPDNNYTNENGLDTSDMEMFKKDPVSSLAREICQNSIDAAYGEKPVRVEFSLFRSEEIKYRALMILLRRLMLVMNIKRILLKKVLRLEN